MLPAQQHFRADWTILVVHLYLVMQMQLSQRDGVMQVVLQRIM